MKLKTYLLILAAALLGGATLSAQDYDVAILNGRVMDPETNFDGVRNVGIKDGKIVVITENAIKGKETIDAKGHVVAPGFIEGHQHATDPFSRKVNLRDGLTTQMDFEAGAGDIAKWYAEAEGKTQANYGMVVLALIARISVLDGPEIAALGNDMGGLFAHTVKAAAVKAQKEGRKPGWTATLPNKEEMTEIMSLVDEGLRQGALGVGVPVGYMTTGVTQYELYKYQELAAKYGRVTNGHVRFAGVRPPTGGQLGYSGNACQRLGFGCAIHGLAPEQQHGLGVHHSSDQRCQGEERGQGMGRGLPLRSRFYHCLDRCYYRVRHGSNGDHLFRRRKP